MSTEAVQAGVTDHRGLRVMSLDECVRLIPTQVLARLAFVFDGEPVILPVTVGLDDLAVVFRTSWGTKMQAAIDGQPVAIEVDQVDPAKRTGWSVVVKGIASVVYDPEQTQRWERLRVPYWLDHTDETFWIRVIPEEVSGRELMPRRRVSLD